MSEGTSKKFGKRAHHQGSNQLVLESSCFNTKKRHAAELERIEFSVIRYRALGPFDICDEQFRVMTAPKVVAVLATLLLNANSTVSTHTLAEELWGDRPPASADTTLQTYIYQIRGSLGAEAVATRQSGYSLQIDDAELDLYQYRFRVDYAVSLLDDGEPNRAFDQLVAGLSLWKGPALCNVRSGRVLEFEIQHLAEERQRGHELLIESAFRANRHRDVIGKLRQMAANDQYNEWVHARLIEALAVAGRRDEALRVFADLRKRLAEGLGLEPMHNLQELEQRILNG